MINGLWAKAIGGPGHGKFLLGQHAIGRRLNYGSRSKAIPDGWYSAAYVQLDGWRIKIPVWVHESMWRAGQPVVPAYFMPGYVRSQREVCRLPLVGPSPQKMQW